MTRLSSAQYTLLRKMPSRFGLDLARRYKQTTFGSFARRGYVKEVNGVFTVTSDGRQTLEEFSRADVFRRQESEKLSKFFRRLFKVVSRKSERQ